MDGLLDEWTVGRSFGLFVSAAAAVCRFDFAYFSVSTLRIAQMIHMEKYTTKTPLTTTAVRQQQQQHHLQRCQQKTIFDLNRHFHFGLIRCVHYTLLSQRIRFGMNISSQRQSTKRKRERAKHRKSLWELFNHWRTTNSPATTRKKHNINWLDKCMNEIEK